MTGVYAPYIFAGGGRWLKRHLLQIDAAGCLISAQAFQGETERTIAYTGIVFPAFPNEVADTPENALLWLMDALVVEKGATVATVLEQLFPHPLLIAGHPVELWNLEAVLPEDRALEPHSVIRRIYP